MSDKINGFTVIFEKPVSEEYMDTVKNAVYLIKGVLSVEDIIVDDPNTYVGEMRERTRIYQAVLEVIKSDFNLRK
jgi:hypothetical protein